MSAFESAISAARRSTSRPRAPHLGVALMTALWGLPSDIVQYTLVESTATPAVRPCPTKIVVGGPPASGTLTTVPLKSALPSSSVQ